MSKFQTCLDFGHSLFIQWISEIQMLEIQMLEIQKVPKSGLDFTQTELSTSLDSFIKNIKQS